MTGRPDEQDPRRDAAARRRLAEIFGDVLPDATGDDRDEPGERGAGQGGEDERDRWYRDQVPPHHA